MPDVGLTSSVEPLDAGYKVVIKYSIEVNGLAVYSETYDTSKLSQELQSDESKIRESWFRRLSCVIGCRNRRGFSACLTRCLLDGNAYDEGHKKRSQRRRGKTAISACNIHEAKSWFEVLQTTDISQTAVMSLSPQASTGDQPESHEHSQQVLLLLEGELLAELDGKRQGLKTGDALIIPPKVKHKFTNEGKKPALTFNVYCPPEYPPDEKG